MKAAATANTLALTVPCEQNGPPNDAPNASPDARRTITLDPDEGTTGTTQTKEVTAAIVQGMHLTAAGAVKGVGTGAKMRRRGQAPLTLPNTTRVVGKEEVRKQLRTRMRKEEEKTLTYER